MMQVKEEAETMPARHFDLQQPAASALAGKTTADRIATFVFSINFKVLLIARRQGVRY